MDVSLIRHPGAWAPIMLSITALTVVLVHVAMFGPAREADEGAAAHLWQLLMAAQLPVVALFAVKWLPRRTAPAIVVLLLQAAAAVAALAPVYLLRL